MVLGQKTWMELTGGAHDGQKVKLSWPPPTTIHVQRNAPGVQFTESLVPLARGTVEMDTYVLVQDEKTGKFVYVLDSTEETISGLLTKARDYDPRTDKRNNRDDEILTDEDKRILGRGK